MSASSAFPALGRAQNELSGGVRRMIEQPTSAQAHQRRGC